MTLEKLAEIRAAALQIRTMAAHGGSEGKYEPCRGGDPCETCYLATAAMELCDESERLRALALDVSDGMAEWMGMAHERAEERDAAVQRAESLEKATHFCDKCKPNGGEVGQCQRCALIALSRVVSRIDYALGNPNEYALSMYDFDFNEERVIKAALTMRRRAEAAEAKLAKVMMVLVCYRKRLANKNARPVWYMVYTSA